MKILSDLVNSCEYLNIDKTCTAFIDNQKAQTARQLKCQNNEKNTCCYLCEFRPHCSISCKYLGQNENYSTQKTETNNIPEPEVETKLESVPVSFCLSCNAEMSSAKTQFNIENWNGPTPLSVEKVLPVTVYLCPKCGRIEFKANLTPKEAKP